MVDIKGLTITMGAQRWTLERVKNLQQQNLRQGVRATLGGQDREGEEGALS